MLNSNAAALTADTNDAWWTDFMEKFSGITMPLWNPKFDPNTYKASKKSNSQSKDISTHFRGIMNEGGTLDSTRDRTTAAGILQTLKLLFDYNSGADNTDPEVFLNDGFFLQAWKSVKIAESKLETLFDLIIAKSNKDRQELRDIQAPMLSQLSQDDIISADPIYGREANGRLRPGLFNRGELGYKNYIRRKYSVIYPFGKKDDFFPPPAPWIDKNNPQARTVELINTFNDIYESIVYGVLRLMMELFVDIAAKANGLVEEAKWPYKYSKWAILPAELGQTELTVKAVKGKPEWQDDRYVVTDWAARNAAP
ncbi:hypothetical protein ABW19_dt0202087 [Dactylella cylindrospora]|nr:hypothetical protein ABW19_dt0202087 [Dactylella cylindrospora]